MQGKLNKGPKPLRGGSTFPTAKGYAGRQGRQKPTNVGNMGRIFNNDCGKPASTNCARQGASTKANRHSGKGCVKGS